jgi:hypothetical protein
MKDLARFAVPVAEGDGRMNFVLRQLWAGTAALNQEGVNVRLPSDAANNTGFAHRLAYYVPEDTKADTGGRIVGYRKMVNQVLEGRLVSERAICESTHKLGKDWPGFCEAIDQIRVLLANSDPSSYKQFYQRIDSILEPYLHHFPIWNIGRLRREVLRDLF